MKINLKFFTRIKRLPILLSIFGLLAMVYDLGYAMHPGENRFLQYSYLFILVIGAVSIAGRYLLKNTKPGLQVLPLDVFLFGIFILLVLLFLQSSESH